MENTIGINNLEYGLFDYKCNLYLGENARYTASPFNQVTNRYIRLPDGKSNIIYLWSDNFEHSLDMINSKKFIIPPSYRRIFYPHIIRDKFMGRIFRINLLKFKEERFDIIRQKTKLAPFSQIKMPVTDINTFFLLGDIYENSIPIANRFSIIRLMRDYFGEFVRIATNNTPSPVANIDPKKEDGYRIIIIDASSFKFKGNSGVENKLNPLYLFYLAYLKFKDLFLMNVDMDFLICGKNMFMKFNPAKCKNKDLNRFKLGLFRIMNLNIDNFLDKAKDKESEDIKHPERTNARHNIINDVIDPYVKGVSPDIKDALFMAVDRALSSDTIKNPVKAIKDFISNKPDIPTKPKKDMLQALNTIEDDELFPTELPEENDEKDEEEDDEYEPSDEQEALDDYVDDKEAIEDITKEEINDDKVKSEIDTAIQDKTIPIKNLRSSSITSARDLKLREEQKKIRVKDSTIGEILSRDTNDIKIKEEDKSKVLKSANTHTSSIKFSNFEKTYLEEVYVKDTISMFDSLKDKNSPFYITSIEVKDSSTTLDYKETWTVKLVDENKKHHTIKVDMPKFYNNKFMYLNGNKYIIMKQNFYNPLVKDTPDTVILTTNYNKITISRKTNKSLSYIEKMFSVIKKSDEKIFIAGASTKDNAEFVCSLEYDEYAKRLFKFKSKKCEIYFSRKYIKEKLNIDVKLNDDEYVIGFEGDSPIIINENSGLDRNGRTITEIMVEHLPENLKSFYASAKGTSQPMYAECKLAGQFMAVGAVLVGWVGLTKLLELMNIKYTIIENKRSVKREAGKGYIRFSDGILEFDNKPIFSQLVLNGLLKMKPENYKISDFDTDVPFNNYLYTIWGNYRGITEVAAFYEFLMDPITIEVCKDLALPINIEELILYAVKMLSDEHYSSKSSDNLYRVRTCEIIPGILYSRIAAQYKEYVKSGRRVPLTLNQNAVITDLVSIPTVEEYSTLNPTLEMTKMYTIGAKGYRGSNSDFSYDMEKRAYDKTSIGKLAVSSEPNGGVGVTRQMVVEPTISSVRGYRDPVEDIDELKDVNIMAPIEMLTPGTFRMDDPLRTSMANKQSGHIVPVVGGVPSLISNGFDESVQFHLSNDFVINAEDDGKVVEIDEKTGFIIVQYKNGKTQAINMNPDIVKNSGGGFYLANKMKPTVTKVGETFKKDEPLAYHDRYFRYSKMSGLRYVVGPLAKVAFTSSYNTYEDAGVCTKKMSDKLRTDVVFLEAATFKRNSNILSMAKIGDHVNIGDSLIKFNTSFEDDEIAKYISKLSDENELAFQEELKTNIKTSHAGKIIDIKVYTLLDPDELSLSLGKIVKQFFARGINKKNLLNKYDKTPGIVKCGYMLTDSTEPSVNKYNKIKGKYKGVDVLIEFYIEHSTGLGVGDKVALYSANKNIISEMIPEGYEPYSESRPDEEISMIISPGCVARRMITSILPISATMKVLVELKRKIASMVKSSQT